MHKYYHFSNLNFVSSEKSRAEKSIRIPAKKGYVEKGELILRIAGLWGIFMSTISNFDGIFYLNYVYKVNEL